VIKHQHTKHAKIHSVERIMVVFHNTLFALISDATSGESDDSESNSVFENT
jgi:hypothetical protein